MSESFAAPSRASCIGGAAPVFSTMKNKPILFIVTPEERRELERRAGKLTISQYLRQLCGLPSITRGRPKK